MAGKFIARWIGALGLALIAIYFLLGRYDYTVRLGGVGARGDYVDGSSDGRKPAVSLGVSYDTVPSRTGSVNSEDALPIIPPLYTAEPDVSATDLIKATSTDSIEPASANTTEPSTDLSQSTYNRTLVIARLKNETVDWISEHLSSLSDLRTAIYTVDEPTAPYIVPSNKGHEVMPYLTYIIDHYDNLTSVNVFMHAHRIAWHNNDLLGQDAVRIIKRLRPSYVLDGGYINLRCHQDPGCPDHLHPATTVTDINREEETEIAHAWGDLFPGEKVPKVLSQPCCSQFALSRDKIRSIPLAKYHFYRDWLLNTHYEDKISGRIWEYVWQYLFLRVQEYCPSEFSCYCDGYGVCFEGEEDYKRYLYELRKEFRELQPEYDDLSRKANEDPDGGWLETGRAREIMPKFREVKVEMERTLEKAFERGRELGVFEE